MNKDYVSWNSALSVGFPEIDEQHKILLSLINQVWAGLVSQAALSTIDDVVMDLDDYARTHFAEEEALMAQHGFPDLEAHKECHAQFMARVSELDEKIVAGDSIGLELLSFLSDWLSFHISMVDRQYAQFIRSKEGHEAAVAAAT